MAISIQITINSHKTQQNPANHFPQSIEGEMCVSVHFCPSCGIYFFFTLEKYN